MFMGPLSDVFSAGFGRGVFHCVISGGKKVLESLTLVPDASCAVVQKMFNSKINQQFITITE